MLLYDSLSFSQLCPMISNFRLVNYLWQISFPRCNLGWETTSSIFSNKFGSSQVVTLPMASSCFIFQFREFLMFHTFLNHIGVCLLLTTIAPGMASYGIIKSLQTQKISWQLTAPMFRAIHNDVGKKPHGCTIGCKDFH